MKEERFRGPLGSAFRTGKASRVVGVPRGRCPYRERRREYGMTEEDGEAWTAAWEAGWDDGEGKEAGGSGVQGREGLATGGQGATGGDDDED